MNLLLSAKELHRISNDSNLAGETVIVDTRPLGEYLDGHIPGAINIDLMQFHWIDTSRTGIRQFNRQMNILFSNLGLANTKFAVFYDNISGPSASRGVWLSHYFSQLNAFMVDGGLGEWKAEGLEIEKQTNAFSHSERRDKCKLQGNSRFENGKILDNGKFRQEICFIGL